MFASSSDATRAEPSNGEWSPPSLSIIVPSFNERENIEALFHKLDEALVGIPFEMIVVDDNSPDGSAEETKRLAQKYSNIRCIRRFDRRGLSSACIEGMASAASPLVAVIDADHQHDERILPKMVEAMKDGADLVVGSRYTADATADAGFSSLRLKGSHLATWLASLVTGRPISDPMSGFFIVRRDRFDEVAPHLSKEGFKILLDIIVVCRRNDIELDIREIPYQFRSRHAGESKMNSLVVVQFLGLWLSQLTGGRLPASFLLFSLVGLSGVAVHMAALGLLTMIFHQIFVVGQIVATISAMTWNFFLNNSLTYSDRRLKGPALWKGLIGFCLICSLGGIANISVASAIFEFGHQVPIAGLAGALMSSVFNYSVTRIFTWK
ncbi:glycosyltransferase family 2 protein [Ancylobacter sp. MQZ15Z-1]|uniref:Glycosyltransferase family 2 protein n=2 Tax=Ancylobacter mangrovi TaxID=2972472 RepID=A0A9X2PMB2_9HYPH|nr:glycosyltransferase family 2 protein [Ancylobacter mangrovi]MCS0496423.1 glycosyltransferase family 2 protein [Ancylobacter mangrovi]